MENKNLSPITTLNLVYILTDKLGKQSTQAIPEFSATNHIITHTLSETIFNGRRLVSDSRIEISYENALLTYDVKNGKCEYSHLFFNDDKIIDELAKYCEDNYPAVTNNTWLIVSPDNPNISYTLFYFDKINENKQDEKYFRCMVNP